MAAGSDQRARDPEPDGGHGGAVGPAALAPGGHGQEGVRGAPPRRRIGASGRLRRSFVAPRDVRRPGEGPRAVSDLQFYLVRKLGPLNRVL